jgi:hypothetical protein
MDRTTQTCVNEDLDIQVKATRRPRFKAGAELSGKVNRISIDVDQDETADADKIAIKLIISSEVCEKTKPGNSK